MSILAAADLDLFQLLMGLLGGLGVFLFGMDMMSNALKLAAGNRMRSMLARLTRNRFSGVATGTIVTGVLQSSSVTTVLTVGFVSAGLMTFAQSIPVIFGSNIGTTITAQIVSLKVTDYALLLVAVSFVGGGSESSSENGGEQPRTPCRRPRHPWVRARRSAPARVSCCLSPNLRPTPESWDGRSPIPKEQVNRNPGQAARQAERTAERGPFVRKSSPIMSIGARVAFVGVRCVVRPQPAVRVIFDRDSGGS